MAGYQTQQVPIAQHDIEKTMPNDPAYGKEQTDKRQAAFGLNQPGPRAFMATLEFVSLGCYCGPSCALYGLGIRGCAYPFDWVRSPVGGVIKCLVRNFEDFLTFTDFKVEYGSNGYLNSRWGGSFWHHNPQEAKAKAEFTRRIERMLGLGNVAADKPRLFVRAANSTAELEDSIKLYDALEESFLDAKIYLLVLIDLQEVKEAVSVPCDGKNLLFWKVHKGLWEMPRDIHKCDDYYGEGVAFAIRYWSGDEQAMAECKKEGGLVELNASCVQFDGGNPATTLMNPRPYLGQALTIRRRRRLRSSLSPRDADETTASRKPTLPTQPQGAPTLAPTPSEGSTAAKNAEEKFDAEEAAAFSQALNNQAPPSPPPSDMPGADSIYNQVPDQLAELVVPANAKPGDYIHTTAFGRNIRLQVPPDVKSGEIMMLRLGWGGEVNFSKKISSPRSSVPK